MRNTPQSTRQSSYQSTKEPGPTHSDGLLVLGAPGPLKASLVEGLGLPDTDASDGTLGGTVVYVPATHDGSAPDPDAARLLFRRSREARAGHLIVLSSGLVNEPSHRQAGFSSEAGLGSRPGGNAIAHPWRTVEEEARRCLAGSQTILTVLRLMPVLVPGNRDFLPRLLSRPVALTVPGYDPPLQLLSPQDLVAAVRRAAARSRGGTYHVVPRSVVPLSQALRLARTRRIPLPASILRLGCKVPAALGLAPAASPADQLEYLRHPWTLSGEKIRRELGFVPAKSSSQAVTDFCASGRRPGNHARTAPRPEVDFDDHGLDRPYVHRMGQTLFRFLHDAYWRVEYRGLEHVPARGRAVLAGVHRGFMPWDGVMTFHLIVRQLERYPRFLIHPALVKFPFLSSFMRRIGGVIACRENADWVLQRDELLGIYPEGIQGAFRLYRDAYRLGKFGRDEFVKMALRNRSPIVPFVTLGSAEVFPILAKLQWRWWKRWSEWPCLPITPTLGLLPLPTKWHTWFLEPLKVQEEYPPEAAHDPTVVAAISQRVRRRMEGALTEMLSRRKSVFHGSILGPEASSVPLTEKPA